MKGRKLTLQGVLNLEDGTKVWVEDDRESFSESLCTYEKENNYLVTRSYYNYVLDIYDYYEDKLTFYEWIEESEMPYPNNMQQIIKNLAQEVCNLRGLDLTDDNIRLIIKEFS